RTGAAQVVPVYRRFIKDYPTLTLATTASEEDLRTVLRPLGRLGRATHLRSALQDIETKFKGRIPDREELLTQISGVGRYTARAILAFAFRRRVGLFDPNIGRLLSRVFGLRSERARAHTDPEMWMAVDALTPRRRTREFNWALLDLGARVCLPR